MDDDEIDALLRSMGLELPDVEGNAEGGEVPPRLDEEWGETWLG